MNSPDNAPDILESVIRARKTDKITCEVPDRQPVPEELQKQCNPKVLDALEVAGWAPFHYVSDEKSVPEPWRACVLWDGEVTSLLRELTGETFRQTKLQKLTAACSALVLVTWVPDSNDTVNVENIAAASAMVQNFLLMLTAHGMSNYWSSGGDLGKAEVFRLLGIPESQRLLAAVFIEYEAMKPLQVNSRRDPGKHREKRTTDWIRIGHVKGE